MDLITVIELAGTVAKCVAAEQFLRTWGWGDAAWGDPLLHPGEPDDEWHKRRRLWFNVMIISAFIPGHWIVNVVLLVVIGAFARRFFRAGVKEADPETYRRWYGK
jgi:hypothetical protein|tara:strand:- start:3483 stop:3797 length:315 start_codon:yes stop_codon:yes gene_type:complete